MPLYRSGQCFPKPYQKNQQLWLSCYPCHKKNVLLWTSFYDACPVLSGFQAGFVAFFRFIVPVLDFLSGGWSFRALFCNMELCRKGIGGGKGNVFQKIIKTNPTQSCRHKDRFLVKIRSLQSAGICCCKHQESHNKTEK